jgi:RNA polymerase sigma factor (TIGR02999 family)
VSQNEHTAEVTRLLRRLNAGDRDAAEPLMAFVYGELRGLARGQLHRGPAHATLQPTALVHEAYLRLVGGDRADWEGRQHFYAVSARAMRQVLIDHARARASEKRGGDRRRVPLDAVLVEVEESTVDLLALEEALEKLSAVDEQLARIVELRFFTGLEHAEAAAVLGLSTRTVERGWRTAKAWLHQALSVEDGDD